jgi:hypothetical protein
MTPPPLPYLSTKPEGAGPPLAATTSPPGRVPLTLPSKQATEPSTKRGVLRKKERG